MDYKQEIYDYTVKMVRESGIDAVVKINENVSLAAYTYDCIFGGTIHINPLKMAEAALFRLMDFEDYTNIVIAHELGHAIDTQYEELVCELQYDNPTEQRKEEIMYTLEYNAWKNGVIFVKSKNINEYHDMNHEYVNKFKNKLAV